FAGTPRTRQQDVVGRPALHEMLGIAPDLVLLTFHLLDVAQAYPGHMAHRLQHTVATAALAVAKGDGCRPVRRAQRPRQHGLDAVDQLLGAMEKTFEMFV